MAGEPVPECPVCHQPMAFFFEIKATGGASRVYKCHQCKITRLVRPPAGPVSSESKPSPTAVGERGRG